MERGFSLQDIKLNNENDISKLVQTASAQGEEELLELRNQTQLLAEQTSVGLKRNVFRNYALFIETAKEISVVEGEMFQLQQLHADQKDMLERLSKLSVTSENAELPVASSAPEKEPETDSRTRLSFLLEKVEGCAHVTEVPGRELVHSGDLLELDPETYTPVRRIHAFLLTDTLLLAIWLPSRKGPVKYRFEALLELDNLATVNVRDSGGAKNAFKLLVFPDAKMYQADTIKTKRQWLDTIEDTKKRKTAADSQKKERATSVRSVPSFDAPEPSLEIINPFLEEERGEEEGGVEEEDPLAPDWLREVPEDLDVFIAVREFEEAVDLVDKTTSYLADVPKTPAVREFRARVDQRVKVLTDALIGELQTAPERTLRGGPRATRLAVRQLIRLGKTVKACELFLASHSSVMKYSLRQVRIEGATALYVRHMCSVFFSRLQLTAREYRAAFSSAPFCLSAFVVWCRKELTAFVDTFKLQVFASKAPMPVVAECVQTARQFSDELADEGLEVTFELDALIYEDISGLLQDASKHAAEAVRQRAQEDLWRPVNAQSEAGLAEELERCRRAGLPALDKYVFDTCWIRLTRNTLEFAANFLESFEACLRLYSPDLHAQLSTCLHEMFKSQMRYLEKSLYDKKFQDKGDFILQNAEYLIRVVLPGAEERWSAAVPNPCQGLASLHRDMKRLKNVKEAVVGQKV